MKKLLYYILLLPAVFVSCTEGDDFHEDDVTVEVATLEFEAEGGMQSFVLQTREDNISWEAEITVDWCEFKYPDPAPEYYSSNDKWYGRGTQIISVEVPPNVEGKERETDLVIIWDADGREIEPVHVMIKQKSKYSTELSVSPQEVGIATNSTWSQISIQADAYWEVVDIPRWMNLSRKQGFGSTIIHVYGIDDGSHSGKFSVATQGKSIDVSVRKWGKTDAYLKITGGELNNIFYQKGLFNVTKKLIISGGMITSDFSAIKNLLILEELDLTDVQFLDGVNQLPQYALADCSFLSVLLPKGLLSLKFGAFYNCRMLQSIDIPEGVVSIDGLVFNFCTALQSVTLPGTLRSIGSGAFSGCTNLKEIHVKNPEPIVIDYITHIQTANICTLYVPKGSKEKYRNATGWSDFLNIVEE